MNGLFLLDPNFANTWLNKRARIRNVEGTAAQASLSFFPQKSIFNIQGSEMILDIQGPLSMAGPDELDIRLGIGGTSYEDIVKALSIARNNSNIKSLMVRANTPGGEINGADFIWQTMSALASEKPTLCQVTGMLASAGYYILCPVGRIEATAPTDEIGSIGVIYATWDFSEAYAKNGISRVEIRSKNAPKKAHDGTTKAGRDVLQERIDALERVFYQRISESRGVSPSHIAENFGQGALLVARDPDATKPDAIRAGLIDGLSTQARGPYGRS